MERRSLSIGAGRPTATAAAALALLAVVQTLGLAFSTRVAAADPPVVALQTVIGGIVNPTCIVNAGDGSGRIFLCEQSGVIRVLAGGALLPDPFLDISGRVSCCGEQGLLSVAFPPSYAATGRFYVNYTDTGGDTVISRFRIASDATVADPDSEQVILHIAQPYSNHNGGQLQFGPDGFLYIGMGDGGSGGDPGNRAQDPAELLGKLLRIDVDSGAEPYAIPASNPLRDSRRYRSEIWALGLRNPWRFSFDRATGDLWIADVGQNRWEEIDRQPAASGGGENYGWRRLEGTHCYGSSTCSTADLVLPIAEYSHDEGCSVTGGYVYRGALFPRLLGTYLFGDYCSGTLWKLQRDGASWASAVALQTPYAISTFGEDEGGELYLADYDGGTIFRVADTAPGCALGCSASVPASAPPGVEVTLAGSAVAAACPDPLSYQWDFGDGTSPAAGESVSHSYATSGSFAWRLTVSSGSATCSAGGVVAVRSRLRRRLVSH